MSDKKTALQEFARNSYNSWRQKLNSIQVEFPVRTVEEARHPRTIEFCIQKLQAGHGLMEIRRMLGCGSPGYDPVWRAVRKQLISCAIPENHEEALLMAYTEKEDQVEELKNLIKELEAKMDDQPRTEEEAKTQHHYYRMKLDAMKILLDNTHHKFQEYMALQNLKLNHKVASKLKFQITIQNKIPRPERAIDITPEKKKIGS